MSAYSERHCSRGQGRLSGRTMKRRESMTEEPLARSPFFLRLPSTFPSFSLRVRALCTLLSCFCHGTIYSLNFLRSTCSFIAFLTCYPALNPACVRAVQLSRNLPARTHAGMAVQTRYLAAYFSVYVRSFLGRHASLVWKRGERSESRHEERKGNSRF